MHIRNFRVSRECGLLAAVAVLLIAQPPATVLGNTCVAGKPVKMSGRFCGRVFDQSGTVVANADLNLVDEMKHSVAAETHADAHGDFAFPTVPPGKYRLTSPGWIITWGEIQITGRPGTVCRHPLYVVLGLESCEGWISQKKARHYREPKGE